MGSRVTRMVSAVLLSPLAVVPVCAFVMLMEGLVTGESGTGFGSALFLLSYFALVVAYPAIVLVGLPAHFVMSSLGVTSYLSYVLTGATLSVLVGIAVLGILFDDSTVTSSARILRFGLLLTLCGAAVSAVFRKVSGPPTKAADAHV